MPFTNRPSAAPGPDREARIKGERLPNLSRWPRPENRWESTKIANWYRSEDRIGRDRFCDCRVLLTGLFAVPIRWVLIRDPRGRFKPQTLRAPTSMPIYEQVVRWFVMRWQLKVTFQEARRHLGFETQRQWTEPTIRRTTPALLGLFSVLTLFAHRRMVRAADAFRRAAWYHKRHPTFADALALVRKEPWAKKQTLRVARADRHGKSPAGFRGTTNRGGLLCSLMAKVDLGELQALSCTLRSPSSVSKARKRSLGDYVFWDSRILDNSPPGGGRVFGLLGVRRRGASRSRCRNRAARGDLSPYAKTPPNLSADASRWKSTLALLGQQGAEPWLRVCVVSKR